MAEQTFKVDYEDQSIHGIIHEPDFMDNNLKKTIVLFLHGWAGYRIGPHGILLEIARNLTEQGLYCCRFDYRGRGYSDGVSSETNVESIMLDVECVINYLKKNYNPTSIVIIGMCIGAKIGFSYLKSGSIKIDNLISISSPLLNVKVNKSVAERKARNIKYYFGIYIKKLFHSNTWIKLFQGNINFKIIWNIFFKTRKKKNDNNSQKSGTSNLAKSSSTISVNNFSNFKGKVLSIHGLVDPESKPSAQQIENLCLKYSIDYDLHLIPNADHNFYSIERKREIILLIKNWLDKNS